MDEQDAIEWAELYESRAATWQRIADDARRAVANGFDKADTVTICSCMASEQTMKAKRWRKIAKDRRAARDAADRLREP